MFFGRTPVVAFLILIPKFLFALPSVTLESLQERAKTNHPEHQIFELRHHSTSAMLAGEVYLPSPMLSYEEMTGAGMIGMKQSTWQLRQRVPFLAKTYLGRELYARETQAIHYEMEQAQKNRFSKITTEYFRWLAVKKKLKIKKEEEILLSQLIAVQQTRYLSQKVSQVELVALQIERGNLLTEITELEAEDKKQQTTLEILSGPGDHLRGLEPKDLKLSLTPLLDSDEARINEQMERSNSELFASKEMAERGRTSVTKAKVSWVPDLEIMITKRTNDLGDKQSGWQLGLEIPLWLAGEQRARVNQARAEASGAELAYEEKKRQLLLEAQTLINDQRQLRKQLELMENGLVQWSNQNVKSARVAYQTGKLEYASFLALMQSAYQTLVSYEDLKVKVLENQEQLHVLMGGN